jgi:hypothetical protein
MSEGLTKEQAQDILSMKDKPLPKRDISRELKQPFKNVHYRPQQCYNGKVLLLAYIDGRDAMKRLDDVVGFENWQDDYKEVKGNLYCTLSICINGQWISKCDCGTESNTDAEKGEASDAFKRAGVKWGIGRYLYYLPKLTVQIQPQGKNYIKIKDKATNQEVKGYYDDPQLPVWAIPTKETK